MADILAAFLFFIAGGVWTLVAAVIGYAMAEASGPDSGGDD